MELGLTYMRSGDYTLARQWLEKVRRDYTGYLLETVVHFRIHCALRSIKTKEKEQRAVEVGVDGLSSFSDMSLSRQSSYQEETPCAEYTPSKNAFAEMARKYQRDKGGSRERIDDFSGL